MIIQCERCQARYRIDDAKVTPQGVKVKCKKCQHIFVVKRPEERSEGFEDLRIEEFLKDEEQREEPEEERPEGPSRPTEAQKQAVEEGPSQEEEFHFPSTPAQEGEPKAEEEERPEEEREEEVEEQVAVGAVPSSRRRLILIAVLLILLIILGLLTTGRITLVNQWLSTLLGGSEREVALASKEFLSRLKGYYVVNEKEGVIFVVEGVVANPEAVEVPLKRVRVAILGKDGRPLQERLILLGEVIPREELTRLTREEIEGRLKGGTRVLPPNTFLPFMTVFYKVPTDLSEFVVEVEE